MVLICGDLCLCPHYPPVREGTAVVPSPQDLTQLAQSGCLHLCLPAVGFKAFQRSLASSVSLPVFPRLSSSTQILHRVLLSDLGDPLHCLFLVLSTLGCFSTLQTRFTCQSCSDPPELSSLLKSRSTIRLSETSQAAFQRQGPC